MNPKVVLPLLLLLIFPLSACFAEDDTLNPPSPEAGQVKRGNRVKSDPLDRVFKISPTGIGPIKLGMTLGEARKKLPDATLERTSDGDGVALVEVRIKGENLMILYAEEDDSDKPIDWSRKITSIETFNPACKTDEGVKAGTLVVDAEKTYGKTKSIRLSEIESRQHIEFEKHPKHMSFRIDYSGIFAKGSRETTRFKPQAMIESISVH